jgi:hypothetical protein
MKAAACSLALPVLVAGLARHAHLRPQAVPSCSWTSIDSVWSDSFLAYAESPQIVHAGGWTYLLSSLALRKTAAGQVASVGGRYNHSGVKLQGDRIAMIPLPAGLSELGYVRAASGADGSIDAIWVGPRSTADSTPRLWTATLRNDSWTPPVMVVDSRAPRWGLSGPSRLSRVGDRLLISAPSSLDSTTIYTARAGRWSSFAIPEGAVLYTTIASLSDSVAVLGFVGGSDVFATRLNARLQPTRIVKVADGSRYPAHYPQLLPLGRDSLAMTWVDFTDGEDSFIEVATSADRGQTWARHARFLVAGGLQSYDAAVVGDGSIVVAGRGSGAGGPHPFVARWVGERWVDISPPAPERELGIGPPRVEVDRDSIRVYWGTVRRGRETREPPTLVIASRPIDCRLP